MELISLHCINLCFLLPGSCGDIGRQKNGVLKMEMSQTETTSNQQCLFRVTGFMGR